MSATESPGLPFEGEVGKARETLRVLIPSPLGFLGIEFLEETVTSLVIVPKVKERKTFLSLTDALRDSGQPDFLEEALGRFSEYFAGARRKLRLDWKLPEEGLDDVGRKVLTEVSKIPFGKTAIYQEIASSAGLGDSYRQVRSILMANPLPILIPCHRVIPRKGGAGSWIAGTRKKEWLLKMEREAERE
jgi:methylated-DNA-[protein]-cysteine S-methyltransferase